MQSSGERSCRRSLASRRSMIRPTADARGRPACCWVAACDLRSSSHQATKVPANDIETSFLSVGRPSRQQQPVLLRTTIPWRRAIMRVRSATTEAVRYITVRAPARNLRVSTQRRDRRVSHFDRTCELSFCYKYLQAMLEGQPPTLARRSTGPRAPPPPCPGVLCGAQLTVAPPAHGHVECVFSGLWPPRTSPFHWSSAVHQGCIVFPAPGALRHVDV